MGRVPSIPHQMVAAAGPKQGGGGGKKGGGSGKSRPEGRGGGKTSVGRSGGAGASKSGGRGGKGKGEVLKGVWRLFNVDVPVSEDPGKDSVGTNAALLSSVRDKLGLEQGPREDQVRREG